MSENKHRLDSNNLWFGLVILAVGVCWLMAKMNLFFIPGWLFSWEVVLIAIGLILGIRSRFSGIGWLIPVMVGGFFFLEDIPYFHFEIRQYGFPVAVILIGILFVYRALLPGKYEGKWHGKWNKGKYEGKWELGTDAFSEESTISSEDLIDINNSFGGIKKKVISKTFMGGRISTSFGNTEIDLTQSDIEGIVRIDFNLNCAGVELIVPSNWEVKSEVSIVLAGIDESRKVGTLTPGKTLLLTGSCFMSGIEIKSY